MKNKKVVALVIIGFIVGVFAIYEISLRIKNNSVVEGSGLNKVTGHNRALSLNKIGKAPVFSLLNQNNQTIDNRDFLGKVYVLEFFFSTCPTICPKMNQNLIQVSRTFYGNPNFGIVSITINPENDTPEVLKKHAEQMGITSQNWHFLTGKSDYIFDLSNKGFNLYAGKNSKVNGGFEHSGLFALIDKNGYIRSRQDNYGNPIVYYDGLEPEGIAALINDIKLLLRE
jgi:protein SCO1/2